MLTASAAGIQRRKLHAALTIQRFSILFLLLVSTQAAATGIRQPLWELGMGVFPSTFPAYRGSEDQKNYLLPFPYAVYRGTIFKVDREGIRAQLFDSYRLRLNISLNGAVPVSSDDSAAREGMPDLLPTFEIGPSLNIRLTDITPRHRLSLRLPARAAIATDFTEARHAGWLFNPHLNFDARSIAGGWNLAISMGPIFATREYHAYYFDVKPKDVTPTRPAYRASSGYSGTSTVFSFSRRYNRIWLGGFLRYDYLAGAEFDDSPLVKTDHSLMAGVAIAWIFSKSSVLVSR